MACGSARAVLGLGGLPAHRRSPRAQAPDPRAAAASSSRSCAPTPPSRRATSTRRGMARNLLKVWPALWTFAAAARRRADQQPRRTRAPRRGHLPQAQPRQPIRTRRTTHRATALGAHHLPPATPIPVRLPRRRLHRPQPRRPRPTADLTPSPGPRPVDPLNAYAFCLKRRSRPASKLGLLSCDDQWVQARLVARVI